MRSSRINQCGWKVWHLKGFIRPAKWVRLPHPLYLVRYPSWLKEAVCKIVSAMLHRRFESCPYHTQGDSSVRQSVVLIRLRSKVQILLALLPDGVIGNTGDFEFLDSGSTPLLASTTNVPPGTNPVEYQ